MTGQTDTKEFRITGRHVLIGFIVFFGVILLANVVMVTLAVTSFTGEDTPAAYGTGIRYNDILADRAASRELGWVMTAGHDRANGALEVVLQDADGKPVAGLALEGRLERPVQAELDRELQFEEIAPGVYKANVADLSPGQWDLIVAADSAQGTRFKAERRL